MTTHLRLILRDLPMVPQVLDMEIERYLALLNARQKQAVLTLVKAFASKQDKWRNELYRPQRQAIKRGSSLKKSAVRY